MGEEALREEREVPRGEEEPLTIGEELAEAKAKLPPTKWLRFDKDWIDHVGAVFKPENVRAVLMLALAEVLPKKMTLKEKAAFCGRSVTWVSTTRKDPNFQCLVSHFASSLIADDAATCLQRIDEQLRPVIDIIRERAEKILRDSKDDKAAVQVMKMCIDFYSKVHRGPADSDEERTQNLLEALREVEKQRRALERAIQNLRAEGVTIEEVFSEDAV